MTRRSRVVAVVVFALFGCDSRSRERDDIHRRLIQDGYDTKAVERDDDGYGDTRAVVPRGAVTYHLRGLLDPAKPGRGPRGWFVLAAARGPAFPPPGTQVAWISYDPATGKTEASEGPAVGVEPLTADEMAAARLDFERLRRCFFPAVP